MDSILFGFKSRSLYKIFDRSSILSAQANLFSNINDKKTKS